MEIGMQFLFSVDINGESHDAVATGLQDEKQRPFFHVSIYDGPEMNLYDMTRLSGKGYIWYDRQSRTRSELAQQVGAEILAFAIENC